MECILIFINTIIYINMEYRGKGPKNKGIGTFYLENISIDLGWLAMSCKS